MKKLSVLIALALVLTIGGAYATWTFATGNIADATVENIQIGMEVEETGSKGTLAATFTPNYTVEPGDGNTPILKNNATAENLVITFTTSASAEQSIKENGVAVKVSIDDTTPFTATLNDITKTTVIAEKATNGITIQAGTGTGKWDSRTDNGNGTYTFTKTITSDDVMGWIEIKDATPLTDVDNAEAFEAAVKAGRLTITVTTNVG